MYHSDADAHNYAALCPGTAFAVTASDCSRRVYLWHFSDTAVKWQDPVLMLSKYAALCPGIAFAVTASDCLRD